MTDTSVRRSRADLLRGPLLIGVAGLSATTLLALRDPHTSGSYGICPFLALTGHPCPGCGGLRAVNDLTHGDVLGALSSNVLAVAFVAVVGVAWVAWVARRARGVDDGMIALSDRALVGVAIVAIAFGILRNSPWGAWLAP